MNIELVVLWLLACSPPPTPPSEVPRVELSLPIRWAAGTVPTGSLDFFLEEASPALIYLDGLWWGVEVELDGNSLPRTLMGHAPKEVVLPTLNAGAHHLELRLYMPTDQPKALSLANRNWRPRAGVVELRLVAGSRIGAMSLDLRDGSLYPKVEVIDAPEGHRLALTLSRDGQIQQSWEPITAEQGFEARTWRGERWDIGTPALWVATAVLQDAQGRVLDLRSERVGIREVKLEDGSLFINGQFSPLMALRVNPLESPARLVEAMPEVGANAVEVHGEVADGQWLATFDEWGVPVIHMPRCDGALWNGVPDFEAMWKGIAPMAAEQDRRLLEASAARPAVLAWVCEGSPNLREAACGRLREDPLHRPVLGLDTTALSIAGIERRVHTSRAWIIEIGSGEHFRDFAASGAAFLEATGKNGPGGVFFPPPPEGREAWAKAWKSVSEQLETHPWYSETRRATSVLLVRGLQPGAAVWLELPWMASRGAVADIQGVARIEVWYQGEAVLKAGKESRKVQLTPDAWVGTKRVNHAVTVDLRLP